MQRILGKKREYKTVMRNFFKENYPLFVAPLFVALLYGLGLACYHVFPFGNRYVAADYDLASQICPLIEHFYDVFKGRSTVSFTYSMVGGMDIVGSLLYCAVSPFTLLFFFFGEGNTLYATWLIILCKLATVTFAGTWFAKKLFRGIPNYICIGIGVLYAYCGYAFVSNTYINWMDFLIYGPFCVAAFRYFVKTGRYIPFSVALTLCVYTCFSISCFSMFLLFPILIFYGMFCVEQGRRTKFIAYLCLSFAVAVGLAMPILLPAFFSYLAGARGGGLFDKMFEVFKTDTVGTLFFDREKFLNSTLNSLYSKFSYIFSDSIFLVLTLGYFCRKGLRNKFSVFMLATGILIFVPVVIDESMLLLNMGSYLSYSLRFGFLNALYFLSGACLFLQDVCYKKGCAYDGENLKDLQQIRIKSRKTLGKTEELPTDVPTFTEVPKIKKTNAWKITTICLSVSGAGFFLWFLPYFNWVLQCVRNNTFDEKVKTASVHFATLMKLIKDFSVPFVRSLGGFELILTLFCVVAVVAVPMLMFVWKKRISPKFCSLALIPMLALQVGGYNQYLIVGNRETKHVQVESYQQMVSVLDEKEEGAYYRFYDYSSKASACVPMFANANAFTTFSSMTDKKAFITWELFGFNGSGKTSYKGGFRTKNYGKELAFSLLGYKYVFVSKKDLASATQWKQFEQVMISNEHGEQEALVKGGYYVFENTTVFPLGYRVERGDFRFVVPNIAEVENRKKNQFALYEFLRGESVQNATGQTEINHKSVSALSEYLWGKSADVKVEAGKITAKVENAKAGECLMLNFSAPKGYKVKVNGKEAELIDNDLNFLSVGLEEGENTVEFEYRSPYGKYFAIGIGVMALTIGFAIWMDRWKNSTSGANTAFCAVISVTGILLASFVLCFFMAFPIQVNLYKWLCLLKDTIGRWISSWFG